VAGLAENLAITFLKSQMPGLTDLDLMVHVQRSTYAPKVCERFVAAIALHTVRGYYNASEGHPTTSAHFPCRLAL
jgi:hypothetical protein